MGRGLDRGPDAPSHVSIDWRASADNLAQIDGYLEEWLAAGESRERIVWARTISKGMREARDAGEVFWVSRPDLSATPPDSGPLLVRGTVYVLTDASCASACLDAVDLWKPLGAVQVGRQTSADTVYMDTRTQTLPSGIGRLTLPMKIWRGRPRGHNEPHSPARLFNGDMSDDAALLEWIRGL